MGRAPHAAGWAPTGIRQSSSLLLWGFHGGNGARLRFSAPSQTQRTGLSALPGFSPNQVNLLLDTPHREIADHREP